MAIKEVRVSGAARKSLQRVPDRILDKLETWVRAVERDGLETVRKTPGYHDEPLHGVRKGQRSIRLSRSYRAIYVIRDDAAVEFVSVEEVSKHEY